MSDYFSKLIGNEQIKTYLNRMVQKNLVGNSLLFAGPEGVGKSLFAIEFIKLILHSEGCSDRLIQKIDTGNHPDVHILRPEGKIGMHSMESLRNFNQEVSMEPFEATHKFFIIHDADRMLPSSANALLKTFEEPSLDSIIILLSNSPDSLLTTIKSRCRTLNFQAVSTDLIEQFLIENHQIDPVKAKQSAFLAHGSISNAVRLVTEGGDELRHVILKMLGQGPFSTYKDFTDYIKQIVTHVESKQQITEEQMKLDMKEMTAAQKQALEKEISGSIRMKLANEANEIFEVILSWYRDIELLKVNGSEKLLCNSDYHKELSQTLSKGILHPISAVQKMIKDATISLDRSTSLQIAMETLLLKLRYC